MKHTTEVVADFRQFYAVDLPLCVTDEIEGEFEQVFERYSMLFVSLPREARSIQRLHPETRWSEADYLLWHLEFNVRALQWSLADEKSKRGLKPPKPLPTPAETAHKSQAKENALKNKDEIDKALGMKGA